MISFCRETYSNTVCLKVKNYSERRFLIETTLLISLIPITTFITTLFCASWRSRHSVKKFRFWQIEGRRIMFQNWDWFAWYELLLSHLTVYIAQKNSASSNFCLFAISFNQIFKCFRSASEKPLAHFWPLFTHFLIKALMMIKNMSEKSWVITHTLISLHVWL